MLYIYDSLTFKQCSWLQHCNFECGLAQGHIIVPLSFTVSFISFIKCYSFQLNEVFLCLQVIEALLKKFKIADNPRKFALFECYQEQDDHG